jgi:hypothetical protein
MVEKGDRLRLSRDIEVIADQIAQSGQIGRANELKVVAAHLRAKEVALTHDPVEQAAPRAYVLGIALLMSWLAVVLLVVLLLA